MRKICLALFAALTTIACTEQAPLNSYDEQLADLQQQYKEFHAEAPRFFLFGMGNREKFIYKDYQLINIDNDSIVFQAQDAVSDSISPSDYTVSIETRNGTITITEDEESVWLIQGDRRTNLSEKQCSLNLPSFQDFKYGKVLRVLHHELLFNIRNSRIFPNIFVYKEPFYRDAFMAALCLEKTNNVHLLTSWITHIDSIYDMQNREPEADNLGELLYMLSFIPKDSNTVLRRQLQQEIKRQTVKQDALQFIMGHTDGADNAEYQTQILKLAVKKNALDDSFTNAPSDQAGAYFDLCWFTQGNAHRRSLYQLYKDFRFNFLDSPFPYLQWARAHYYDNHQAPFNHQRYPLSWEKRGGSAHFEGMRIISEKAADERICYPHAWTAAELFLKLYDEP